VNGPAPPQPEVPPTGFERYTLYSILTCLGLIGACAWYASRRVRTPAVMER
jgi:hypothetical protein